MKHHENKIMAWTFCLFSLLSLYFTHKPFQHSSLNGNMFNLFNPFLQTGQKNSLTQETELLESLLQEVEHQVC